MGPSGVTGELGQAHVEPHPCRQGAGHGPLSGRLEQLLGFVVVAGVGEGMGLVHQVLGDAPAGQPVGQVGVIGPRLPSDVPGLVEAPDAQEAGGDGAGDLDLGCAGADGPIASVIRSASAGRPEPARRFARRASTAAMASGSVSRSRADS